MLTELLDTHHVQISIIMIVRTVIYAWNCVDTQVNTVCQYMEQGKDTPHRNVSSQSIQWLFFYNELNDMQCIYPGQ